MAASKASVVPDSRARLIAAARDLLWRNSYASVSVDDLCKRAEVNKGSFYHHFPSKAELATAAFDGMWEEMRPFLDGIFSPLVPALERFDRYCAASVQLQTEKRGEHGCVIGCPFTNLGSEVGTQDDHLRRLAAIKCERSSVYFAAAIRDGQATGEIPAGDPAMLAAQVQAFVTGVATQARIANDLAPFAHLTSGVRRLLGVPS
jgi:TetR/AcrR family transcriptional regulator, transcriptional repressor for nem operon